MNPASTTSATTPAALPTLVATPEGMNPISMIPIQPAIAPPKTIIIPAPKKPVLPPLVLEDEIRATKHVACNTLAFQVKSGAGILFTLLNPPSHAFESPDITWLRLLEAIALIPSGKPEGIVEIISEVYRIMPLGEFRNRFQSDFRNELYVKSKITPREGLVLKDKVNRFLRAFLADPVQGYVTSKTFVHDNYFTDDIVRTPVGLGFVRAYRSVDKFYIVLFPWGHGYIHERCISSEQSTHKRPLEGSSSAALPQKLAKTISTKIIQSVMQQAPDTVISKEYIVTPLAQLEATTT